MMVTEKLAIDSFTGIVFVENDDMPLQISPTISSSCDEESENELGSRRHRRQVEKQNRTMSSFGRSDMT
jgi:hypothetical protein